jgi:CTP synthase
MQTCFKFMYACLILLQALLHSSVACSLKPSIQWVAASDLEDAAATSVSH